MSYANGIDNVQQVLGPSAPSATSPVLPANALGNVAADHETSNLPNSVSVDETNLSSTGGLMAQALEVSDTRYAKVAALQQAIAAGTYSVPSSDIAGKIVQSLLD